MTFERWLLAYAESAQYVVYLLLLILLGAIELRMPARQLTAPKAARWRTNLLVTLLNVLAMGALPLSIVSTSIWAEHRSLGGLRLLHLPPELDVALGLGARGFISFITHLLMHKVPLFWKVHRVHHTDTELDVSTTVRFHPLEFPLQLVVALPLVVTLGISPAVLLAYEVLDAAVTVFSHANIHLPSTIDRWLRYVIVTPSLHRIHHSSDPRETDSNFGAVFPIWDLVLGTYRAMPRMSVQSMTLGLDEVRDERSLSVLWLLTLPFRGSLSGKDVTSNASQTEVT